MSKRCPQCQEENPNSANVCMHCGKRLVETAEMSKMDVLSNDLIEAKDTIRILKNVLKEKEKQEKERLEKEKQEKELEKERVEQIAPIPPPSDSILMDNIEDGKTTISYSTLFIGWLLTLIVGGGIVYFLFYKPCVFDRDATRFYTLADNASLRSSQKADTSSTAFSHSNKIATLPYGSELIVYKNKSGWSKVRWRDSHSNKAKKGYVASAYVLSSGDFDILNSIWGNPEAKDVISRSKCRLALLSYFKEKNLSGWKVYANQAGAKYNTAYYAKVIDPNSKYDDFAVIIKNGYTNDRRCLLFKFDNDTEMPRLVFDEQAPPKGDIVSVTRDHDIFSDFNTYNITYSR